MPAEPEDQYDEFKTLAVAGDIEAMRKLVADGMDLNDDLDDDTTLLEEVIGEICAAEGTPRYDVVREMLALGADPKRLSEKGSSPLFAALLTMDYEMLQILLEAGADPNAMVMDSEFESLYDWAEGDYQIDGAGQTLRIKAGDVVVAPTGAVHGVLCTSVLPLVILSVVSPAMSGYELA